MVCIVGSYKYDVLQIRHYLSVVSGTDVLKSLLDSCDVKHLTSLAISRLVSDDAQIISV